LRKKLSDIYEYMEQHKCININQEYIDKLYLIDTIIEILQDKTITIPQKLYQPLIFDTLNKKTIYNHHYKQLGNFFILISPIYIHLRILFFFSKTIKKAYYYLMFPLTIIYPIN